MNELKAEGREKWRLYEYIITLREESWKSTPDVRTQDLQMLMDDIEREELSKEKNEMCGLGARRKTRVGTGEVKSTAKKADKRDVDSLVAFIQGDISKSDRKNGIKNATTKPIKRVKKNTSKTSTASES